MKRLTWDYTTLADAYVSRPNYAAPAIDWAFEQARLRTGAAAVDMGAGAGHLTSELAHRGLDIVALEPNPRMRAHGMKRTSGGTNVRWIDAVMEDSGLPAGAFSLASYGSSFGVVDRQATLREACRILAPGGFFLSVFNHRDLDDPLQREIEDHIRACIPAYAYGTRREDQTPAIDASGLFGKVQVFEAKVIHHPNATEWVRAWWSHATLQRQAGDRFASTVEGIAEIVARRCGETIAVPYTTRAWLAERGASTPWSCVAPVDARAAS